MPRYIVPICKEATRGTLGQLQTVRIAALTKKGALHQLQTVIVLICNSHEGNHTCFAHVLTITKDFTPITDCKGISSIMPVNRGVSGDR